MDNTVKNLNKPLDDAIANDRVETSGGETNLNQFQQPGVPKFEDDAARQLVEDENSMEPDPKRMKLDKEPTASLLNDPSATAVTLKDTVSIDVGSGATATETPNENDMINSIDINHKDQASSRPKEETPTSKSSKNATPVPSISKEELLTQSGRNVEDIIDGSNLRQFLNKTLSGYLVDSLNEIVKLWEDGEFEAEFGNELELKRKVAEKFGDIIKNLANK